MSNKITTLGYFLKRLKDSGYTAKKVYTDYTIADPRVWTIVIDPKGSSVFCTCITNDSFIGENYFEFYDGNQFIPGRLKLQTSSIEIVVEHLIKYNIRPR